MPTSPVFRSNVNRNNPLSGSSSRAKMEDPSLMASPSSEERTENASKSTVGNSSSTTPSTTTLDVQIMMQMLQKTQMEIISRLEQVTTRMDQLTSKNEQDEKHREQQMENMSEQIDAIKLINSSNTSVGNQLTSTGRGNDAGKQGLNSMPMVYQQSYNHLRIVLDKQIDELKPYFGKKQENVDTWIRKIDKLAEIAKMSDDEVFTLAKLKLQGDAEKWWDNKKKEIDSWATFKSKLLDTFGALGKSHKLELEATLHHRQQHLGEPATKYWNDMMSHCSAYDETMSTQDRVWRIFNGALPEFRNKYENKNFDDVDQLLKALIQHEESRQRISYGEQERYAQVSALGHDSRYAQDNMAYTQQQLMDMPHQPDYNQQQSAFNPRSARVQQPNSRAHNNNNRWNSNRPN